MPGIDDLPKSSNFITEGAINIAKDVKNYVDGRPVKDEPGTKEAKNRMALFPPPPFLATEGEKFRLVKQIANGIFAPTVGLLISPGYALTAAYINSLLKNQEKLEKKLSALDTPFSETHKSQDVIKIMKKYNETLSDLQSNKASLNRIRSVGNTIRSIENTIKSVGKMIIHENSSGINEKVSQAAKSVIEESATTESQRKSSISTDNLLTNIKGNLEQANFTGINNDLEAYDNLENKQRAEILAGLSSTLEKFGISRDEEPNAEIRLLLDGNNPIGRDFENVTTNSQMSGLEFLQKYIEYSSTGTPPDIKENLRKDMIRDNVNIPGSLRQKLDRGDETVLLEVFKHLCAGLGNQVNRQHMSPGLKFEGKPIDEEVLKNFEDENFLDFEGKEINQNFSNFNQNFKPIPKSNEISSTEVQNAESLPSVSPSGKSTSSRVEQLVRDIKDYIGDIGTDYTDINLAMNEYNNLDKQQKADVLGELTKAFTDFNGDHSEEIRKLLLNKGNPIGFDFDLICKDMIGVTYLRNYLKWDDATGLNATKLQNAMKNDAEARIIYEDELGSNRFRKVFENIAVVIGHQVADKINNGEIS